MLAADRIAWAVRAEDPEVIRAVIAAALAHEVPPGGPNPVYALITALAVQIDPETRPVRDRIAWTFDVEAINTAPGRTLSTASMAQPGGLATHAAA